MKETSLDQFWDQRYQSNETVYGLSPNEFFKSYINKSVSGTVLLPCEGEGRNAIYAAKAGWKVDAFDFSSVAINKALAIAEKDRVIINYEKNTVENFSTDKQYDLIALVYVHLAKETRIKFHRKMVDALKVGGTILLEAFNTKQMKFSSGGPKDLDMLYSIENLQNEFKALSFQILEELTIDLKEGSFHQGKAAVVRMIASKK
jgi:2-polyprenyl-3-methyl-5-hydroxy-6-metoxy-1,4-benzoquinol methylase